MRRSDALMIIMILTIGVLGPLVLTASPVSSEPELETYFHGYVTDKETGDPLEFATVMIMGRRFAQTIHTDGDGHYAYGIKRSGNYDLIAEMGGYHDQMKQEYIRIGQVVQVNFELFSFKSIVAGSVTDSVTGEPVSGAYVEFISESCTAYNITGEDGRYRTYIESGTYGLTVRTNDHQFYKEADVRIEEGEDNVKDIELEPYESGMFGHVLNGNGDLIQGAYLKVQNVENQKWDSTDKEGSYRIGIEPGIYRVVVYRSGYMSSSGPIEILEGEMVEKDWILDESIYGSVVGRIMNWLFGILGMIQ